MSDRDEVREKLVQTTIALIEQVGLTKLTVRALADAAEVNIAAISYYFGSKENLVAAALDETLRHVLGDVGEIAGRMSDDPAETVAELLTYLLEGTLRYPNVARAHVHAMFTGEAETGPLPARLSPIATQLARLLQKTVKKLGRERAIDRSVQALSAVLFAGFFPGFFAPVRALDTAAARQRYVAELVRALMAPAS